MKLHYNEIQERVVRKSNDAVRKLHKCMFCIKGKCSKK